MLGEPKQKGEPSGESPPAEPSCEGVPGREDLKLLVTTVSQFHLWKKRLGEPCEGDKGLSHGEAS